MLFFRIQIESRYNRNWFSTSWRLVLDEPVLFHGNSNALTLLEPSPPWCRYPGLGFEARPMGANDRKKSACSSPKRLCVPNKIGRHRGTLAPNPAIVSPCVPVGTWQSVRHHPLAMLAGSDTHNLSRKRPSRHPLLLAFYKLHVDRRVQRMERLRRDSIPHRVSSLVQ